jgi:hypothetical protein
LVVAALIIAGGVMGFDLIMRMQAVITIITGVLTIVFIALTIKDIKWHVVSHLHSGSFPTLVGGFLLLVTGFGLGWVNTAADYSRYLPRSSSTKGVMWWTTLGGALAPILLFTFGLLLAGSSSTTDVVPRSLRDRSDPRTRRRRGARHLLVGALDAVGGHKDSPLRRRGYRWRDHAHWDYLYCLCQCEQLPFPV